MLLEAVACCFVVFQVFVVSEIVVRVETGSRDAISSDLGSDARYCLTPPPFGHQCTVLLQDAVGACVAMPLCVGLVCPDVSAYSRRRFRGGAICQARGSAVRDERNHGMCKPHGCAHVSISRANDSHVVRLPRTIDAPSFRAIARPAPRWWNNSTTTPPLTKFRFIYY